MNNNLLSIALYLHILTCITVLFYIWHKIIGALSKKDNQIKDASLCKNLDEVRKTFNAADWEAQKAMNKIDKIEYERNYFDEARRRLR